MLKKRSARLAAFTLIEVMTVMTIMMAETNNYGEVKRIAYQTSCRNNLEQLYKGIQMYEMNNGTLPSAAFYPKHPKTDADSIVKIMDPAYEKSFVCPVFPSAIRDSGLTYLYNDALAGQTLDSVPDPRTTWLMVEMNAVSDKIQMPHPGGFHILYCDGHIEVTKQIPAVFAQMAKKASQQGSGKGNDKGNGPKKSQ